MRRGFLAAGGRGHEGSASPGSAGEAGSSRVGRVSDELAEAETALRTLRRRRMEIEGPSSASPDAGEGDLQIHGEAVQLANGADIGMLGIELPTAAIEELIALESVPPATHRVFEALSCILKAPSLAALGQQQSLPQDVPWENLRLLLRRLLDGGVIVSQVLQALQQPGPGRRLAGMLTAQFAECGAEQGGLAPSRQAVAGECPPAVAVFDFVQAALAETSENKLMSTLGQTQIEQLGDHSSEREIIAQQIADAERAVARHRRKLREIQRSEAAAREFASEHSPVPQEELTLAAPSGPPRATAAAIASPEEACCRQVQFRLAETGVPQFQEPVLQSVANVLLDPMLEDARRVHVVGFSEVREEDDVAEHRAASVCAWFADHGVPEGMLSIEALPGGPRGARRVELRVVGEAGRAQEVRSRAEQLLTRVMTQEYPPTAAKTATAEQPPALVAEASPTESPTGHAPAGPAHCAALEPPVLRSCEELPAGGGPLGPDLRLVFDLQGLRPADVGLEISGCAVRLACQGEPWRGAGEVTVELPFGVHPEAQAARFSRRHGTLTVDLCALERGQPRAGAGVLAGEN